VRGGFSASERDGVGRGRFCTLVQAGSDSPLRAPGPTRHTPVGPRYLPHTGDALASAPPFGYLDWLGLFVLAVLGNMIGGLTLVTLFRLLQVPDKVRDERH
jgi:hypothetical protein